MPFGMIGWTGPWMRQDGRRRLRIQQQEGVIVGANIGRPIVANGDFYYCEFCAAERLLLGEFLELLAHRAGQPYRLRPSARYG